MSAERLTIDEIEQRADAIIAAPDEDLAPRAEALAAELLSMSEVILETWLVAKGQVPTDDKHEGFRLIALHRQAAKGNPSFNACRETCREAVYHHNLILHDPAADDIARTIRVGAMVVRHLALFIGGKLQADGLGEFCCSSRPIRQADAAKTETAGAMEA
ncbi:hypothetical protein U879_08100 [Defluviimonas sp. 20V17]|uniref:Uncharacterized protein n=1 Tax=Allgaiera indica TaxID=765699 RepID=A0AAN4UP74_9RHOB|nr:hypothetical protein [Allgaiera indica]KDB04184.1 hypothetical protein U879_08100 [Defluviimonas sp. 20V17]GHD99493.1 hypothetical protein GCM10008024_07090 [Allgaiera indica]SDW24576.1 hypothetical protein SAMN05444006_102167 [Allgaiera indica]